MKTKNLMKLSLAVTFMAFTLPNAQAQLLKKIGDRVVNTAENKVINKAGSTTSKGMDEIESEVTGKNKKKKKAKETPKKEVDKPISYSNYDFISGKSMIFSYNMAGEKDSDIPEKMLLDAGNISVQTHGGIKVLHIPANETVYMRPSLKNKKYLPKEFTIEFDVLSIAGGNSDLSEINLYLRGKDDQTGSTGNATAPLVIKFNGISGDQNAANYEFMVYNQAESKWIGTSKRNFPTEAVNPSGNIWRHVAISVKDNVGKLYIDNHRIGVLNQIIPEEAAMIDFEIITQDSPILLKNFKIATH